MSDAAVHPHTPDDPDARAVIQAYEYTVAEHGAHAAYDTHFAEDAFYVFYGDSPLAGRYEGRDGLKRWWDTLNALAVPEPTPVIELAGAGHVMYHMLVHFTAPDGEEFETKIAGNYEMKDGVITAGRFWAFEQDELDAFLARSAENSKK